MTNRLILLSNFNNYYNRKIIRYDTLGTQQNPNGYLYHAGSTEVADIQCNFNPNDGVTTKHTVNITTAQTPDYALVCDNNYTILSRWFVLDAPFNTGNQLVLTLYRDTIADEFNTIVGADSFIEKATIPLGDPLLYNNENMTFNQIKTSETEIRDGTNCAWIVGYIKKNSPQSQTTVTVSSNATPSYTATTLSEWDYYEYTSTAFKKFPSTRDQKWQVQIAYENQNYGTTFNVNKAGDASCQFSKGIFSNNNTKIEDTHSDKDSDSRAYSLLNKLVTATGGFSSYITTLETDICKTQAETELFEALNGKYLRTTSDGALYKIQLVENSTTTKDILVPMGSSLFTGPITTFVNGVDGLQVKSAVASGVRFKGVIRNYIIQLIAQDTANDTSTSISTMRQKCTNEVFDMFAIPCPQGRTVTVKNTASGSTLTPFECSKDFALNAYRAIDEAFTSSEITDIQLVPYCPKELTIEIGTGAIDLNGLVEGTDFQFFKKSNTPVGVMFWCSSAQGTIPISKTVNADLSTAENAKISNECDLYRITSPNFNGQFDFSVAKNNGCTGFNVYYAYKPYTPFIQVTPIFNGLYGQDFGDARGLILGGDFSLPQKDTKWQEYELNNKNYRSIFDREIQNLNVNNSLALKSASWSAVAGSVQGGITGAFIGGKIVRGGAVVGGVEGGVASALAGIADVNILKQQQAETLDYKKDLFGMQLGNIRALPENIVKVGAMTPTNKIFPVLEYYTCTEKEKEAFKKKLKYNGMTVGAIGKVSDYLTSDYTYIKATPILLEGLSDDAHYATTIAEEMNKGVRMKL